MTGPWEVSLFDGSRVPPDTREVAAALRRRIPNDTGWTAAQAVSIRNAKRNGTDGFPPIERSQRAESLRVPRDYGDLPLRVISCDRPEAVYLHIHGGGWFMGGADLQDSRLEALADDARLVCVSVEYRLSPEHRHPAAIEDCVDAAVWIARHARDLWGVDRLVIGGDSSGAHLAILTLLATRDMPEVDFGCAHLVYGFYDLALTPGASQFGATRSRPRTADLRGYVDAYLGPDRNRRSPDVSPLYADLTNLCPALFLVGTEDALLDDSLFMYARWLAAANQGELRVHPGAPHNFAALQCAAAADAHRSAVDFIRRYVSDAGETHL